MSENDKQNDASSDGRKVRVSFRRNRSKAPRVKDWTRQSLETDDHELDSESDERIATKGELSRRRTIIVDTKIDESQPMGIITALRGRFSEVDDGTNMWMCTMRRVVRTQFSLNRNPLAIGDRVRFSPIKSDGDDHLEGVIESVEPRGGALTRRVRRRVQTIVANVDQVIIVASAYDPPIKPNLIDRYIVSALTGDITPIICLNKIDLNADAIPILDRYASLGYTILTTSAIKGEGIERLISLLKDRSSAVVGQSGVGKSALLNAVQPGLKLRVGTVSEETGKGRHTTTTAMLHRLDFGGYIVDTPGVRSFDLSTVSRYDLEKYFVDIAPMVAGCKFPNCTHTHEEPCAVLDAVDRGEIHAERYDSYVRLFGELPESALKA